MAVSLKASKQGLEIVDQARKKKGWTKTSAKWSQPENTNTIISAASLKRFWRRIPIDRDTFIEICQRVNINNWQEIIDNSPTAQTDFRPEFYTYDYAWVGREKLVTELSDELRGSCRLLLILGLTGIGKTALAEKLADELQDWFGGDWKNKFRRANFDYEDKPTDFASVAARWLEEWRERLSPEEKKPELLLPKLLAYLHKHQVLVLIDSLERLLTGNEEDGWGDFADPWWEKFFLNFLSAESCRSRLIITSQDLPVKLVYSRYKTFLHHQILYGLEESEQVALFEATGLDASQESPDRTLLLRIGKAYKGHPLMLRVIIGEIFESFEGNVQAYWDTVSSNIEEVEKAIAEAEANAKKIIGADDDWQLHKLTQKVRLEVYAERLKTVFERLATQVRDAYILICAASVYRVPVQEEGWLMQLAGLVKRVEHQECSKERKEKALEELFNRFLVETSNNHNHKRLLGQHNLVRSVAIEYRNKLLQSLK
ncbi:MAG: AAA family ATPase [Iphinoe sp. HA4291-MV1]|jgi:hypothetical protein|nr:AAA family ATPase [Iphinoe sp. HA4291-MV1]